MTMFAPWSATWAAEARSTRWLATALPAAVLVALVPMSASSWPVAFDATVSVNWPLASVVATGSLPSHLPLPLTSRHTVAPA